MHSFSLKSALLSLSLAILLAFSSHCLAQPSNIKIKDVYFLQDFDEQYSLEAVQLNPEVIDQRGGAEMNLGVSQGVVWLRFTVQNHQSSQVKAWLDIGNNHPKTSMILNRYTLANSSFSEWQAVHRLSYEASVNNINDHQAVGAWLVLEPQQSSQLVVRFTSNRANDFQLQLMSEAEFYRTSYDQRTKLALTVGILFALAVMSLLFYLSTYKPHYLIYSGFELATIGYLFCEAGFGIVSFWPENNKLSDHFTYVTGSVSLLFFIWFGYFFLDISKRVVKLKPVYYLATALIILSIFISLDSDWIHLLFNSFIPLLIFGFLLLHLTLSIIQLRHGKAYVWPYGLGLLAELTPGLTFFLSVYGFIHLSSGSKYDFIYIGIVIEGGLFLVAMNGYLNSLKNEKNKINQQLFSIYKERVSELKSMAMLSKDRKDAIDQQIIKSSELAAVSHDIHHNLYDIKLQLALLRKDEKNDEQVSNVKNSLNYLKELTHTLIQGNKNDILNAEEKVNVEELFSELIRMFEEKASAKSLTLKNRIVFKGHIPGSNVVIKRLLENIIRNALDNTQAGGVLFSIRVKTGFILLQVFDTGKGMPEEKLKQIKNRAFKPIFSTNGFGLGFAIVKTLCEQEGYLFDVKSKLSKGSVVSIKIPI